MARISEKTHLDRVEHILASGTGILDFAVDGENQYYTWSGTEDADWSVDGVSKVENVEEDRIILYPEGDYCVCEIEADSEENNSGDVTCYSK